MKVQHGLHRLLPPFQKTESGVLVTVLDTATNQTFSGLLRSVTTVSPTSTGSVGRPAMFSTRWR